MGQVNSRAFALAPVAGTIKNVRKQESHFRLTLFRALTKHCERMPSDLCTRAEKAANAAKVEL